MAIKCHHHHHHCYWYHIFRIVCFLRCILLLFVVVVVVVLLVSSLPYVVFNMCLCGLCSFGLVVAYTGRVVYVAIRTLHFNEFPIQCLFECFFPWSLPYCCTFLFLGLVAIWVFLSLPHFLYVLVYSSLHSFCGSWFVSFISNSEFGCSKNRIYCVYINKSSFQLQIYCIGSIKIEKSSLFCSFFFVAKNSLAPLIRSCGAWSSPWFEGSVKRKLFIPVLFTSAGYRTMQFNSLAWLVYSI